MTISYHQRSAALTETGQGRSPFARDSEKPSRRRLLWILLALILVLVLLAAAAVGGLLTYGKKLAAEQIPAKATAVEGKAPPADPVKLQKANAALGQRLKSLAPTEEYVVVDSALNRVYWRKGEQTLREMLASCGTGNVLEDPASGRKWTFETPRGERKVQGKKADPVWIKPDWAFIEEGEAIPKDGSGRAEAGMMGDYAIAIGNGYYLHGTMYKRLLGRNVSHGCVRIEDAGLEFLFNNVKNGTRVILF